MPESFKLTHLIEVPVEDGIGEGAEEAGDVAQAEPGPEQGVISIGVGSRADTHTYISLSNLFSMHNNIGKHIKISVLYQVPVFRISVLHKHSTFSKYLKMVL